MQYVKNGKTYDLINGTSLDLYEFDCSLIQMKFLSFVLNNSKKTLVHRKSLNYYLSKFQDVLSDSIGEMFLNKVCEIF